MRSILRSTLLASFALTMTWGLSGCEDTTKTTPPAAPTATPDAGATAAPESGKMEPAAAPESGKMEPAGTPAATPPATPPAEPPK